MSNDIENITSAVTVIKTAILQSQARAAKAVNQDMRLFYEAWKSIENNSSIAIGEFAQFPIGRVPKH